MLDFSLFQGQDPNQYSPLTLAFLGDGVYELLVRQYLVAKGNCPVRKLSSRKVDYVRCEAQAKALSHKLIPVLTQEETDIVLRGRNAHVGHVPKNSSVADYHSATALEALFGWLYMKGETARLYQLFSLVLEEMEGEDKL